MEIVGAEATVSINETVKKKRHRKEYRHPDLDKRIRTERTRSEAEILRKASRAGANVPQVLEETDNSIELEKINGQMLKQVIEETYMEELGEQVAILHSENIIHGDLTTSNSIVGDRVYILDFGLGFTSERLEDRAVDIHLLKQVLETSHSENSEVFWPAFLKGYRDYGKFDHVMEQLEEVESRGRYK